MIEYVYLVMGHYSNGVDSWDDVVAIYAEEDDAENAASEMNEKSGSFNEFAEREFSVRMERVL